MKALIETDVLPELLAEIVSAGKAAGMSAGQIAVRAGLSATTISRMKARKSGDFGAVASLASVVGLRLTLTRKQKQADRIADGTFFS